MKKKLGIIFTTSALTACSMFGTPQTVAKLAVEHTIIQGTLVAPPTLMNGNKRLALYLQEQQEPDPKEPILHDGNGETVTAKDGTVVLAPKVPSALSKEVSLCITENDQNKQVLENIALYLGDPKAQGKPIVLYGRRLDSAWHEYVSGVNCTFDAIGLYVPASGQYVIIQSIFGDGLFDQTDWKEFAVTVVKTGIKFVK